MTDPTRQLDNRLQTLTPRQHRVLQLRLEGHSWRTIALALHIHEATARGHYHAALRRIADTQQEPAT